MKGHTQQKNWFCITYQFKYNYKCRLILEWNILLNHPTSSSTIKVHFCYFRLFSVLHISTIYRCPSENYYKHCSIKNILNSDNVENIMKSLKFYKTSHIFNSSRACCNSKKVKLLWNSVYKVLIIFLKVVWDITKYI